ncbi:MAG: ATPase, partial [Oscillospiraceae bacterium]|nr:ATPase [Oscillospiraceae bacterium]
MSNVLNYYSGTNTAFGFKSFYNNIISKNEAKRIIYLKGGPGTGKSSLMKNIGKYFEKNGNTLEYHHCSSDIDSLDGVVALDLGFCIMDATAPHTMDPSYPGAIEKIMNLGDYWDTQKLRLERDAIVDMTDNISSIYKKVYSHLNSANFFWEKLMKLNLEKRDTLKYNKLLGFIEENILSSIPYGIPKDRETFVTSITYDGVKTHIKEKIAGFDKVYVLNGEPGEGKEDILDYIHKRLKIKDCRMEVYFNPLNPNFIEHIVLPDLKLAFVSENEFNNLRFKGQILNDAINPIDSYEKELYYINFHEFIKLAISELKNTSVIHRNLEKIYKKAMNFDEVD